MKTLYIECNMGAAGDMLMGALLELTEHPDKFIEKINGLGIPKVNVSSEKSVKCGIVGTHVNVKINGVEEECHKHEHECGHEHCHDHNHEHHHATMENISSIIDKMEIPQNVKEDVKAIYKIIAEAESQVHGKTVSEIHFHEVGMMDAIADVTGCCMLIHELAPEKIVVSPIKTGFGHVHCAHGIMPVPTPATALILNGMPNSAGNIEGELCTPTGAAILKYFADEYGYQPQMITEKIGCGMGIKDFESANCVRIFMGNTDEKTEQTVEKDIDKTIKGNIEQISELSCNIDDMTPEEIGHAMEVFMKNGALDVYTTSIGMKKSRPGIMLTVLCNMADKDFMLKLIFKHTTTIGIRQYICTRAVLERKTEMIDTKYGKVRVKKSCGFGVERVKPEYEDVKKIADNIGKSVIEIHKDFMR